MLAYHGLVCVDCGSFEYSGTQEAGSPFLAKVWMDGYGVDWTRIGSFISLNWLVYGLVTDEL